MKKLLATLLALSLILGSLFTGMVSVSAATFTPVVNEETESYGLVPYPIETYAAISDYDPDTVDWHYGTQLAKYPYASIDKIGVDGTYGLKIDGEGKDITSYIRLGNGANYLDPAKTYALEFQVMRTVNFDEDEDAFFEYGVHSAWNDENTEAHYFETTGEWETVSYILTPSVNEQGVTGHCHVALKYNIPVGASLYFDNFALYEVTDSTINRDLNYFDRYNAGSRYKYFAIGANRGSFDWYESADVKEVTTNETVVPIEKSDIPLVNNETANHPTNSKFDTMLTINVGDGVNGTAGMKIGYTNGKVVTPRFGLGVQGEQYANTIVVDGKEIGTNYFKVGNTYTIKFKAKKVGTVTDVAFEWKVSSPYCEHPVIAVDVTDEWVQYSVDITMNAYDGNASGIIGHNNLTLKCKVAENSYLYIDDIEFSKASDSNRNILDWGDFDKYTVTSVVDTVLEGVTYEPYELDIYNNGTLKTDYSDKFKTDFVNTSNTALVPATSEVNITNTGINNSYALELTGSGKERVISPSIGTYAMTYGEEYIVKFKMKVSDPSKLTMFNMGIRKRYAWKDDIQSPYFKMASGSNVSFGFMETNTAGLSDVFSTDWQEYSFRIEPWIKTGNDYKYFYFDYTLAEGATVYIDDIELYAVGGDGVNLFTKGNFERISSVSATDSGEEIGYYTSKYLNDSDKFDKTYETEIDENGQESKILYKVFTTESGYHKVYTEGVDYVVDAEGTKFVLENGEKLLDKNGKAFCTSKVCTEDYYFNAVAMPSSLARSGKHVLAAGGIDGGNTENLTVKGRVGFEQTGITPGKSYKISFSTILVGEINRLYATLGDGQVSNVTLFDRKSLSTFDAANAHNSYASSNWQTYEFIFTSEATKINNWPALVFYFDGAAGSGFLLEDVSIREILPDGSLAGNQFSCEGFEIPETPDADFSSNKFWGTDVNDLSFMNDLSFSIDVMGLTSTKNPDIYADVMREDSDFAFANTVITDNKALDVIRYEAKIANNLGKEIWINADIFASEGGALSTGAWKNLLTAAANIVQDIAGDNFQGFYFDEPHYHYASNDEFREVTQFLRETFKKRVFAMNKHDSFNLHENEMDDANVTITAKSHEFVTDVGYWSYSLDGIQTRVNGFNTAYARLENKPRAWFACLLGSNPYKEEIKNKETGEVEQVIVHMNTEEEVIELFNTMLAGIKDNDGFGGIMLYSTGDTNGYNEIKLGEDGKAEYSTYRAIIESLVAELDGEILEVGGFEFNEDGILTIPANASVADMANIYGSVYTNVQLVDGETVLDTSALLNKTGLKLVLDAKTGSGTLSAIIACENDVNGDAACDLRDLVRMKKISGGMEASAEQYAAVGSTVAEGIGADNLVDYRLFLLND